MAKQKQKTKDSWTKINQQIRASQVLVVKKGEKLGVMPTHKAIALARDEDMDLVEVSPNSQPPVCSIMDYGKFKFQQSQKDKKQKAGKQETKGVRFRPNTSDHDVDTKLRAIIKFLGSGKKVQVVVKNKGRELAHKDRGFEIIERVIEGIKEVGRPEAKPKMNGKDISCRLEPL
tara:strand:+ start:659 stop:1180 length:522 start_codon:yes stop_codon:yes gene_type:complete